MQKIKNQSYAAFRFATIIGAGTAFGALAGLLAFVFGGLSYGAPGAYIAGAAGVLLASTASAAVASLPFERARS